MNRVLVLSVVSLLWFNTANAGDANAGKEVFESKCIGCHAGGKNMVQPNKTLSAEDLKANGMDSDAAIISLVTEGKSPMPAFGSQLSAKEIENVAGYVLQQAKAGWK